MYKIGALMAIGYGEAGSKIIAKNMAFGDQINPMVPGEKIISIFGGIMVEFAYPRTFLPPTMISTIF